MAVVQISKIQVRRGQKNSPSGVPQLSSAEFAWAVDSQELFIGNGSVAEGAPYVGNTKILTEHDNILDLAASYQFGSGTLPTDIKVVGATPRSLQSKLDEIEVSVVDFGAVAGQGDDATDAFEEAATKLFGAGVDPTYKKVLVVPNGTYYFERDLTLPSGTILRGETKAGVVLNIGSNNIRFVTADGLELADFNNDNRPRNINISNLTIQRTLGQTVLSGIADSLFENVLFKGGYQLGDTYASIPTVTIATISGTTVCTTTGAHSLELGDVFIPRITSSGLNAGSRYYIRSIPANNQFTLSLTPTGTAISLINGTSLGIIGDVESDILSPLVSQPSAVFWQNGLLDTIVNNVTFSKCEFEANTVSIKCLQSIANETSVRFEGCRFFENDTGIYIQGVPGQINSWSIVDCRFEEVAKQAFRSTNGTGSTIQRSFFKDCGNGTLGVANPSSVIVYFGEKMNNVVLDCVFDRIQGANITTNPATLAVSEVYNAAKVELISRNYSPIVLSDAFRTLAVLSAHNSYFVVNYTLKLSTYSRTGQLMISVDANRTAVSISDHFQYSPNLIADAGGQMMTSFVFDATLADNDGDQYNGSDTIVLSYRNPTGIGATGSISFDVTYGV